MWERAEGSVIQGTHLTKEGYQKRAEKMENKNKKKQVSKTYQNIKELGEGKPRGDPDPDAERKNRQKESRDSESDGATHFRGKMRAAEKIIRGEK